MRIRKVEQSTQENGGDAVRGPVSHGGPVTVSELTQKIRTLLEGEFYQVSVVGELSGWTEASSGHRYFTLKDETSALSGVMWRSRSLQFRPGNGMKVVAVGNLTVYPPRGTYQLDCTTLLNLGEGNLQIAFEQMKNRLAAEGLFDPERKRSLPLFPKVIGVVTSPTGAAIRDILTTLSRRMPTLTVLIAPARVQGAGSIDDIVSGIERLNRRDDIDLLIVGRGGGSIEDLWSFNEEPVARAIAASRIPVISAVGHEIDFTIADFVADVRAATPTAAAEIAVSDRADLGNRLRQIELLLNRQISLRIERLENRLRHLELRRGMTRVDDLVRWNDQRLDELVPQLQRAMSLRLRHQKHLIDRLSASLRALDPAGVLRRGYAVIEKEGEPIINVEELTTGDAVRIVMSSGSRNARITGDG